ncbi:MAG: hypothetical protein MZW92_14650 [Comamonadaceae bacterium]|nr:hypothetical protein [Comamonadaceae bacterium]
MAGAPIRRRPRPTSTWRSTRRWCALLEESFQQARRAVPAYSFMGKAHQLRARSTSLSRALGGLPAGAGPGNAATASPS